MGCPVTNYSIELGRERTEFIEARQQKRLIEQVRVCVVCVCGCVAVWLYSCVRW